MNVKKPLSIYLGASAKLKNFFEDSSISRTPASAFRTYFEYPQIVSLIDDRKLIVRIKVVFNNETTTQSVRESLNEMIAFFSIENMPKELSPFIRKNGTEYVSLNALDEAFEKASEAVGDCYCECEGFSIDYTHELIFEIPSDEAHNQLLANFPSCV